MVGDLALSAVDRDLSTSSVKPKIKKLIFVTSPDKHTLRRKSKDWLARNQENVSEWRNMSCGLLFQRSGTIKIHVSVQI